MTELGTTGWNAKILRALKENSRRFAKAGEIAGRPARKKTRRAAKPAAIKAVNRRRS